MATERQRVIEKISYLAFLKVKEEEKITGTMPDWWRQHIIIKEEIINDLEPALKSIVDKYDWHRISCVAERQLALRLVGKF